MVRSRMSGRDNSREASAETGPQPVMVSLDHSTVRVRWLVVDAEGTPHLTRLRNVLNPEELDRANRFHFEADRVTYVAAHSLARSMLSEVTGLSTRVWRFVKG